MNDLRDLLRMELQDLYSVEDQIIAALPKMIERATNRDLKAALQEHLAVTEQQKARLETLQQQMGGSQNAEEQGLFSRLFRSRFVCEGMQGIIKESNKILSEDMNPEVMDAAILACAQKVEHYEICGYGTARAYAEELGMNDVATTLQQTLDEEYEADQRLTALAETRLNRQAQQGGKSGSKKTGASPSSSSTRSTSRVAEPEAEMEMASSRRGGASRSGANGDSSSAGATTRGTSSTSRSGSSRRTGASGASSGRSSSSQTTGSARSTTSGSAASGAMKGAASSGSASTSRSAAGRNAASSGSTGRGNTGTGRSISGSTVTAGTSNTSGKSSGGSSRGGSSSGSTRGSGRSSGPSRGSGNSRTR